MTDNGMIRLKVKPLAELAIGHLGDLSGDVGVIRRLLHKIKNKEEWKEGELEAFKGAIEETARLCKVDISDWEEETDVRLP